MAFKSVLSKIGKVGIQQVLFPLVSSLNPFLGVVISVVQSAILRAETSGGAGIDKKLKALNESTPQVVRMFEVLLGFNVDEERIKIHLDKIIDGVVGLLNEIPAR